MNLNDTHFTVVCRNPPNFYPFKIILVVLPVQYLLPGIFITYINICLMKTVWVRGPGGGIRGNRNVGNGPLNNAFKAKMRAVRIRGISLLITITFTFIISYFAFLGYQIAYTLIAKKSRLFSRFYNLLCQWKYHISQLCNRCHNLLCSNEKLTFAKF